MKNLTEIIRLLPIERLKPIEILTTSTKSGSKHYKLFKAIKSGEVNSDRQAKVFLNVSRPTYTINKMRLKEKVLNLFLFLSPEKTFKNPTNKSAYKIYKYIFLCRVFMLFGAYNTAISFAQKAIKITLSQKLYEPLFEALQLYLKIASVASITQNWVKYNDLYKEVLNKKQKMEEANYLYTQMAYTLNVERFYEVGVSLIEKWHKRINSIAKTVNNFQSKELKFLSDSIYFQLTEKYHQQIKKCDEYFRYLQSNFGKVTNKSKFQILFYKFNAQFYLQQYKEAEATAAQILAFMPKHTKNFVCFIQVYFLLKMHTNQYKEAFTIWKQTVKHNPAYKGISDAKKELWSVCFAYLAIMSKIAQQSEDVSVDRNLSKVLNTLPNLSKDKIHINAQIRVLKFIYFIEIEDFTKVYDELEALLAYDKRYMKSNYKLHFQRTHHFIKILEFLAKKSFNLNQINIFKTAHYRKMKNVKPIYYRNHFIEILPYEKLLHKIRQQLKAKNLEQVGI